MNDFYKLLKQSIIDRGLDTPEARQAAYAQARRAMINRLWSYKPPLEEREIDHRVEQFDKAVVRIEEDVAGAFAAMAAEGDAAAESVAEEDPAHGESTLAHEAPEDETAPHREDPEEPQVAPATTLDERSLAVERALMGALDDSPPQRPRPPAPHDEDLAVWADDEPAATTEPEPPRPTLAHDDVASPAPGDLSDLVVDSEHRPVVDDVEPTVHPDDAPAPSFIAAIQARLMNALPKTEQAQQRTLVASVGILAVILAGGLAWALIPGGGGDSGGSPAPRSDTAETPVPDLNAPIRLPREAIAVTSGFSLFDGHDPTVFAGDPNNPVRYDGELARIASSTGSSGAKVIIGAGLSNRLAGQTVRVVLDARSARENGATSMRFAYESGVALSHWQSANLGKDFSELSLVWRVPTMRTNPQGDYIVIEPGIPGSGTGVEIRSVRIELANS